MAGGLAGCGSGALPQGSITSSAAMSALAKDLRQVTGTLKILTYNVAGLPAFVSPSNPDENMRQASPHLNRYDVVLAQEDFSYHADLVQAVTHPYQLAPRNTGSAFVGDGLTTLSHYPMNAEERHTWRTCNGYLFSLNDCLGEKGFSVARVWLTPVEPVFVYNLHADAGADSDDVDARADGFAQLAQHIEAYAHGRALIVGGDTNLDEADPRDRAILRKFLKRTGLTDSCRSVGCSRRELDRVFYRSSTNIELRAVAWAEDTAFVDAEGQALSDHPAVAVHLEWALATDGGQKLGSAD